MFINIFLLLVVGCALISAHPDPSTSRLRDGEVDCHNFPTIMSYHVHITYMLTNPTQISEAAALRDVALQAFAPLLGENPACEGTAKDPSGRYDNGRFCMIYDHDINKQTLGPFPIGEWSMFVPVHYYTRVVPWFLQHRQNFSLLVHPNTGCEYEDHSTWAQWTGDKWNLDMSIFKPWTQTESFNQTLGTPENPSCLAKAGMCASGNPNAPGFAPEIVCCAGLACDCSDNSGTCFCK